MILLAGLILRLYHINFQSYWIDEIASMNGSHPALTIPAILKYSAHDQPPAFLFILHGWFKVFPYDDLSGRLVPLLFAMAGIFACYLLGKEVGGPQTGLIAAFVVTFSYIHIFYSQEVRSYTLIVLLSALSFYFFLRAFRTERIIDFASYALIMTIMFYTHYYALVVIAAQAAMMALTLLIYGATRKFIVYSAVTFLGMVVLCLPWIPVYFSNAQTSSFWLEPEPFYFPFRYWYLYFRDPVSMILFASALLWFLWKIRSYDASLQRNTLLLAGCAALCFIIPYIYSIVRIPMLHVRYTLVAFPPIVALIAAGLPRLARGRLRLLLSLIAVASLINLIVVQRFYTKPYKEDWRNLVAGIKDRIQQNDLVMSPKSFYCNYYFMNAGMPYRAVDPILPDSTHQVVWWIDGFEIKTQRDEAERKLEALGFKPAGTDSLYLVRATRYTRIQ